MHKAGKKVLIIEDEQTLQKALLDKFTRHGFQVLEAIDGEQGLARSLSDHPDIILLDIIMPRMDGMTVLKKLREDPWGKTVPVIILTNLSDADKAAEASRNGVYDFLIKSDWKIEDLVAKVRERLGMSSSSRPPSQPANEF